MNNEKQWHNKKVIKCEKLVIDQYIQCKKQKKKIVSKDFFY